jgi:hypothetical protein
VSVRGDSLNRIETIMQRKQLSVLKTLPSHHDVPILVATRLLNHGKTL